MKLKNVNNMQTLAALILDCLQSTEIIAGAADDSPDRYCTVDSSLQIKQVHYLVVFFFYQNQRNRRHTIVSSIFFTGIFS